MSPKHIPTCDLDLILSSNRFNNLESSKKELDSHYQPLKFILTKNNSESVVSPEFNQSLQSESKLINQALQSFDDNKLLMKSLGYAKKH